jgi:hypothetical protein
MCKQLTTTSDPPLTQHPLTYLMRKFIGLMGAAVLLAAGGTAGAQAWAGSAQNVLITFNGCQRMNRTDVICFIRQILRPTQANPNPATWHIRYIYYSTYWSDKLDTGRRRTVDDIQSVTAAGVRGNINSSGTIHAFTELTPTKISFFWRGVPTTMTQFPELVIEGHRLVNVPIRLLIK